MTFILGLTGSIGMGKSTAARIFADNGVPVWDADQTVHALYAPGGAAVAPIAALCPEALLDGGIDRATLRDWLSKSPDRYAALEAVVHPLVAENRQRFVADQRESGTQLVVLDIPLLFESGSERLCDAVLVVTNSEEEQRRRVFSRAGMTKEVFEQILSRQLPDSEKRQRADHVIFTHNRKQTEREIKALVLLLTTRNRGQ